MGSNRFLIFSRKAFTSRRSISTLMRHSEEIRCCGALYKSWDDFNLKPYLPKPVKPELRMRFEYLRSPWRSNNFTVLAFHGCPGNAEHFREVGDMLHEASGANLIVPSFPDITYTLRTGEYFHSAEEKVEMAEALLEKLGISKVDLIVAHSAGSYPALLMTVNQKKIQVRSIALLCSSTSTLLPAYRPEWFYSKLVATAHIPVIKKMTLPAFSLVAFLLGLKKMTPEDVATSMASVYATRYWYPDKAPQWLRELRDRGVPRMAMYGSRDFVVPTKLSEHFVKELGQSDGMKHFIYDGRSEADLRLVEEPMDGSLPRIVHFTGGGHNVMKQFPVTVVEHLLKFCEMQRSDRV